MANILYISTLVLNFSAIAFVLMNIWLNVFSGRADAETRGKNAIKIVKPSMYVSLALALATCLFSRSDDAAVAVMRATTLYSIIAISWLVVLGICGVTMLYLFASKKALRSTTMASVRNVFKIASAGAVIGMLLSWLLS